jgi:hypothetical protein
VTFYLIVELTGIKVKPSLRLIQYPFMSQLISLDSIHLLILPAFPIFILEINSLILKTNHSFHEKELLPYRILSHLFINNKSHLFTTKGTGANFDLSTIAATPQKIELSLRSFRGMPAAHSLEKYCPTPWRPRESWYLCGICQWLWNCYYFVCQNT